MSKTGGIESNIIVFWIKFVYKSCKYLSTHLFVLYLILFTYSAGCTRNEDCHLTEACINSACQNPCSIHNPCAQNAICINTNHGSDCSCIEGYQGNGYIGCVPGKLMCEFIFCHKVV